MRHSPAACAGADGVIHAAGQLPHRHPERRARRDVGRERRDDDADARRGRTRPARHASSTSRPSTSSATPTGDRRRDLPARPRQGFLSWYDETKYRAHEVAEQRIAGGAPSPDRRCPAPGLRAAATIPPLASSCSLAYEGRLLVTGRPTDVGIGLVHVDDVAAASSPRSTAAPVGESYILAGRERCARARRSRPRPGSVAIGPRASGADRSAPRDRRSDPSDRASSASRQPAPNSIGAADGVTYWASSADAEARARLRAPGRRDRASATSAVSDSGLGQPLDVHSNRWPASSRCSSRPSSGHHGPGRPDTIAIGGLGSAAFAPTPLRRHPDWIKVAAAVRRELPRPQVPAARPEPQHGLRGGPLPEHRGVLGPAHRDDHDPRRHLHPRLRVLRRQDGPADLVRRRRAAAGRRGGCRDAASSTWS